MKKSTFLALFVALAAAVSMHVILDAQGQVGPNVDVITGVGDQYTGDPFRQRHNEAVMAISGVNPDHMMVAYNDYSTVDYANDSGVGTPSPAQGLVARLLNFFRSPWTRERKAEADEEIAAAQAWMGWSFSDNGGKNWSKGLHYGHPFDNSGLAPELHGYQAVSDPVIASTQDTFFLGGIAFTPGGFSAGFVSSLIDHNNTETGRNIGYEYTRVLVTSDASHFVDKPSIAALGDHVYAAFVLFDEADPTKLSSKILFFRSADRGNTWSQPGIVISQPLTRNQSPWILVDPNDETIVYIGWRVFAAKTGGLANAIVGRKSTNAGASFTPSVPWPVALLLKAFDQPQGQLNLLTNPRTLPIPRSNAYPTAAIDGNGAIHVALQEWVNPSTGAPLGPLALTSTGVPRVTVTTSYDGGLFWTPRKAIDFGPLAGTQFMPVLTAVGEPGTSCNGTGPRSRVMVMYYDARASGTKNSYVTGGNKQFDVFIAEASACTRDSSGRLIFGPSQQMSRYTLDPTHQGQIVQTAGYGYTAVNRAYEMFGGGSKAFTGDYIHLIPRVPYVNTPTGWKLTTANGVDRNKLPAPVVQGVWADTRVTVLPTTPATGLMATDPLFIDNLAWWNYQPPGTGKAPDACSNAGSRSQDVFTADYAPNGLFAAAPVTFRTSNIPRSYPLYVENRVAVQRFFRLTIDATAMASFNYKSFAANPVAIDRSADVAIGPYSTVTGSVVVGPGVASPVSITIAQITGIGGTLTPNGAKTAVTLNTAGAAPFTQTESHSPVVQQQPSVSHPFQGLNVLPRAAGPTNPLPSPYTDNPYTDNPYTDNPYTDNVIVYDVIDTSVAVQNGGDTSAAFSALLNVQNRLALQNNYVFQTFIYRISTNPALNGCQTVETRQDVQISTIKAPYTDNPYTDNPYTDNPYTDNPYTDNAQPDARASNSTFYLAPPVVPGPNDPGAAPRPGDVALYVLRASQIVQHPAPTATFNPNAQVSLTVVANTPDVVPLPGGGFGFDPGGPPVSHGGAALPVNIAFVQQPPSSIGPGQPFTVQVAIRDGNGNTVTNSTLPVTLAIATNPGLGTLSGFTGPENAVAGIATFTGLSINNAGTGYTLRATAPTVNPATSGAFNVQSFQCYADLPNPVLTFTGTEQYSVEGTAYTRFNLSVSNRASFPDGLFAPAPSLPPCGLNTNASRTWANILRQDNSFIYGFCALGSSSELGQLWFAVPAGTPPPNPVHITLTDRACDTTYTSNAVSVVPASGILFAATDADEFAIPTQPNQLAIMNVLGSNIVANNLVTTTFPLNGMADGGGFLYGGDPGSPTDSGQLTKFDYAGNFISSTTITGGPAGCCHEDYAFDGTNMYRAHFPDQIDKIDPSSGNVLTTYFANSDHPLAPSEPIGMTFVGSQIWVSRWHSPDDPLLIHGDVGTWDPTSNVYTHKFYTPSLAGGLAYDAGHGILWVGRLGGCVEPYDLNGNVLGTGDSNCQGAGYQPFGSIEDTIDGLEFVASPLLIDFQSPALDGSRQMIDPYAALGVTFTASPGVVGLLRNQASVTSACVPPESTNQLLATGTVESTIGIAGYPIKATMPGGGVAGPVTVSVDVQTLSTAVARVQLYDSTDHVLATGYAIPPVTGVCTGNIGDPRGRAAVSASVDSGTVAYATVDTVSGGIVFVIDNFKIQ